MKTIKLILVMTIVFFTSTSYSQTSELENKALPIDPKTNCYIRYYYFPNLQAYFDNLKRVYYYKENNQWKTAAELPANYGGYSLYNKWRVLITDFDGENPQQYLSVHKKLYPYNAKGRFTNSTASTN